MKTKKTTYRTKPKKLAFTANTHEKADELEYDKDFSKLTHDQAKFLKNWI